MRKQKKRGFTLIELIVVVAILVALLLILVPRLTGFTSTAAEVQCQQTRQKVMEMYNAYQIKGEPVSIEDLLKNKDDEYFISTPKCASGGEYSVIDIKGLVTLIKCSKHGSTLSGNIDTTPIGVRNTTMGIIDYINSLSGDEKKKIYGANYTNNTSVVEFIKNSLYNGKWPELDPGLVSAAGQGKSKMYLKMCYNNDDIKSPASKENTIVFASTKDNTSWNATMIYDFNRNCWLAPTKSSKNKNISVNNQSWDKLYTSISDWQPVEYSE